MKLDELPRDYSVFVRPIGKEEWCATVYHQRIEWSSATGGRTPMIAIQNAMKKLEVTLANSNFKSTPPAVEFGHSTRLPPKPVKPAKPEIPPCECGKPKVWGGRGSLPDRCPTCTNKRRRDLEGQRKRAKAEAKKTSKPAEPKKVAKGSHKAKKVSHKAKPRV